MAILPFFLRTIASGFDASQTIGFKISAMFGLSYHSAQLVLKTGYA